MKPPMEVERDDIRIVVEVAQVAQVWMLVMLCLCASVQEVEEMSVKLMRMTTKVCNLSECVHACVCCVR